MLKLRPARRYFASLLLLLCLLLSACRQTGDSGLTIAAAASLRDAFEELGPLYTRQSGQSVKFSFAASGLLAAQIRQGAPYDVFASAGADEVKQLREQNLLRGEPEIFAANRLVLVKAQSALGCDWPALAGHRIAIGNPKSVPAGKYAREVLSSLGQWQRLSPRLILTENVRQAVDYLRQGAVDYALVYASDAQVFKLAVCQTFAEKLHTPIRLPMVVLKASPADRHAESWLRFLQSPQAQEVLRAKGFALP